VLYNEVFEKKMAILSANYAYRIDAEPDWGIEEDLYFTMFLEAGKLRELKHCSKEHAFDRADFVLSAAPSTWKKVLTKKEKFVGAFLSGKIKLEKGDTVGSMAAAPHANTLVDALTQVDLKFPDELTPEELATFRKDLAEKRKELGI
jgi:putative sterol carrier protein